MKIYDATEQSYKNGYKKGYDDAKAEIVRCKDCKHRDGVLCNHQEQRYLPIQQRHFCSYGERIADV